MTVTEGDTTSRKEEEWKKLREMQEEAERNKKIGEAQKNLVECLTKV